MLIKKHNQMNIMLTAKFIHECKLDVYEHILRTQSLCVLVCLCVYVCVWVGGFRLCGHYRSGLLATPFFLQSAPSTAARSLNVMSTHCEIAIKNVINK